MKAARIGKIVSVAAVALALAESAAALPFNDDMVDVQKRTGVIMREKAPGTVAIGMSDYYVASLGCGEAHKSAVWRR